VGAKRDRQADTRFDWDYFFLIVPLAPHFAATGEKEPDFFDSAMGDCCRCLSRRKLKMSHSAALKS
jgi:hypothetical protein